ncbi:MAG: ribosome-binding factor A [Patescibacteria group bacterium]
MSERIKKINQLIKKKIADILLKDIFIKDVLITVQNVDTTKDLKYTKIKVSVMPFERSKEVLKILEKQSPKIQKKLNSFLKIKFVPKIIFKIDEAEERASRIEKILRKLNRK